MSLPGPRKRLHPHDSLWLTMLCVSCFQLGVASSMIGVAREAGGSAQRGAVYLLVAALCGAVAVVRTTALLRHSDSGAPGA